MAVSITVLLKALSSYHWRNLAVGDSLAGLAVDQLWPVTEREMEVRSDSFVVGRKHCLLFSCVSLSYCLVWAVCCNQHSWLVSIAGRQAVCPLLLHNCSAV